MLTGLNINPGDQFGKLTVLAFKGRDRQGNYMWECVCACGNKTTTRATYLNRNKKRNCGGHQAEKATTHGLRRSPEYPIWNMMKSRCFRPSDRHFDRYGGRGITMSDEWRDSFAVFYRDMGARPTSQHSIERVDNDSNYCKENCIWLPRKAQQRNTSANVLLELQGERHCIAEWAEIFGVHSNALVSRRHRGWSDERILTAPLGRRGERPLVRLASSLGQDNLVK